jgi:RNA polymerase-interacting CarD/CdnL/TRCF family regulator
MTVKESESPIGKQILSITFGVGTISAIERLQEDGEEFYVIEYGEKNVKNFSPMDEKKKIRFVAPEDVFLQNLKKLKDTKIDKTFPSRKDRVTYFNTVLRDSALDQIITKILEVNSISDLVVNEKDKLKKLLKSLEQEASIIYGLTSPKSKDFISKFVTVA